VVIYLKYIFFIRRSVAQNVSLLKSLSISHVLNAAFGTDVSLNMVNVCKELYLNSGIQFLGIEAIDMSSFNLYQHFHKSSLFIESAVAEGGLYAFYEYYSNILI
jgi:hypothetical protein